MATVGDIAKLLNVSAATVKNWCGEFGEYLSPMATPEPGQHRAFNEDDIRVLSYVGAQRDNGRPYDDIAISLANGEAENYNPPEDEEDDQPSQLQLMRLTATIARYEGELSATAAALDVTRNELTETRERLLDAEKRAAVVSYLEQEAERLRAENERLQAQQAERPKTFWQRLTGK